MLVALNFGLMVEIKWLMLKIKCGMGMESFSITYGKPLH